MSVHARARTCVSVCVKEGTSGKAVMARGEEQTVWTCGAAESLSGFKRKQSSCVFRLPHEIRCRLKLLLLHCCFSTSAPGNKEKLQNKSSWGRKSGWETSERTMFFRVLLLVPHVLLSSTRKYQTYRSHVTSRYFFLKLPEDFVSVSPSERLYGGSRATKRVQGINRLFLHN